MTYTPKVVFLLHSEGFGPSKKGLAQRDLRSTQSLFESEERLWRRSVFGEEAFMAKTFEMNLSEQSISRRHRSFHKIHLILERCSLFFEGFRKHSEGFAPSSLKELLWRRGFLPWEARNASHSEGCVSKGALIEDLFERDLRRRDSGFFDLGER